MEIIDWNKNKNLRPPFFPATFIFLSRKIAVAFVLIPKISFSRVFVIDACSGRVLFAVATPLDLFSNIEERHFY